MILLADRHIPWLDEGLPAGVRAIRFDGGHPPIGILASADALLVRTVTKVDASLLLHAPRLRWLGSATAGFDHIDTNAVADAGVRLFVASGCNASAVGDYVARVLADSDARRVAIVGYGHTGKAAAQRLSRQGRLVVPFDPPLGLPTSWDEVLGCDAVSFHVPLTGSGPHATRHMVRQADFNRARWRILIQASRGGVVDESALKSWIRSGGAAVVDVWENEPEIDTDLCALASLATPHIAGYSVQAKFRATRMCLENLSRVFDLPLARLEGPALSSVFSAAQSARHDLVTSSAIRESRNEMAEIPLHRLSELLKSLPTAATFNRLRNESPLRVEAE